MLLYPHKLLIWRPVIICREHAYILEPTCVRSYPLGIVSESHIFGHIIIVYFSFFIGFLFNNCTLSHIVETLHSLIVLFLLLLFVLWIPLGELLRQIEVTIAWVPFLFKFSLVDSSPCWIHLLFASRSWSASSSLISVVDNWSVPWFVHLLVLRCHHGLGAHLNVVIRVAYSVVIGLAIWLSKCLPYSLRWHVFGAFLLNWIIVGSVSPLNTIWSVSMRFMFCVTWFYIVLHIPHELQYLSVCFSFFFNYLIKFFTELICHIFLNCSYHITSCDSSMKISFFIRIPWNLLKYCRESTNLILVTSLLLMILTFLPVQNFIPPLTSFCTPGVANWIKHYIAPASFLVDDGCCHVLLLAELFVVDRFFERIFVLIKPVV